MGDLKPRRFAGWKIERGPSTFVDGIAAFSPEPWVYHTSPGGAFADLGDHPWTAADVACCEHCEGMLR